MRIALLLLTVALLQWATPVRADGAFYVNGERVAEPRIRALETRYAVEVSPGRYWYDQATGLWGIEGGPTAGRVQPGLSLGGALRADASRGDTGVSVNGRELHRDEYRELVSIFGFVAPGNYWLDAWGVGGRIGEPAAFDLRAAHSAARKGRKSLLSGYFLTGIAVIGD